MADASSIPTGINGLSDESVAAAKFQSLWDTGAADSQNPNEAAQLQAERAAERTAAPAQPATAEPAKPVQPAAEAVETPPAETPEYASLDDYLTKAQLDAASFYELPVTVKVGGKESQVKLAELLKSHQLESDYTQKTQQLAEQRRGFEQAQAQQRQAMQEHLQRAEGLANIAYQQLMGEFQGVDWNQLRATDPTNWAVKAQEFQLKNAAIQQQLGTIQQQRQQLIAQSLPQEREKMLQMVPEWQDPKNFESAREAISKYAPTRGITPAELGGLYDHRFMAILHDASRAAALQAELTQLKGQIAGKVQQVRAAPPAPVVGARINRDPKVVAYQNARERLRANPRDEDAQAAAFDAIASRF